jgi:hypothetical protein
LVFVAFNDQIIEIVECLAGLLILRRSLHGQLRSVTIRNCQHQSGRWQLA